MKAHEIELKVERTAAKIIPGRGALVTELWIRDRPVLYLDRETLLDCSTNVRGGIPLLFPVAGRLQNDRYLFAETEMKQHGFARRTHWTIEEVGEYEIRMGLSDNDETRLEFPFAFHAQYSVSLMPSGLHLTLLVTNTDSVPFAVAPGWHPYFACKRAEVPSVVSAITNSASSKLQETFDFGCATPVNGMIGTRIPGIGHITLRFAPEMRHLQFWSLQDRDFVCIEPYWAAPNAVNTSEACVIQPHTCRSFWLTIQAAN
jgi:galactose mutarotase-like enzyme